MFHCLHRKSKASGKVLLTGGYLILFPKYRGISIALNCKFHANITFYDKPNTIHIICPQWLQKTLIYNVSKKSNNYIIDIPETQLKNPFIQSCLQCFIQFLYEIDKTRLNLFDKFGIEITLYGDDSFYNKRGNDNKEKKMGLGSSAALTVSLIKSLFKFFKLNNNTSIKESDLHNLCQLSHFISQGKIGSGFDIATSLFGSILFRRATLNIDKSQFKLKLDQLAALLNNNNISDNDDTKQSIMTVKDVLNCMVMSKLDSIKIPPHLCIIMGVPSSSFGSKTPKMVSKVLKWKDDNKEQCETLWNSLNESNENIINIFQTLCNQYDKIGEKEYIQSMERFCSNGECKDNDDNDMICNELKKLRLTLKEIRKYQKQMSKSSEVNIVPEIMDDILNKSESINCVIQGGIPGAGGFDALYVLCVGKRQTVIDQIEAEWTSLNMQILDV